MYAIRHDHFSKKLNNSYVPHIFHLLALSVNKQLS
jgi:hypothetical protein